MTEKQQQVKLMVTSLMKFDMDFYTPDETKIIYKVLRRGTKLSKRCNEIDYDYTKIIHTVDRDREDSYDISFYKNDVLVLTEHLKTYYIYVGMDTKEDINYYMKSRFPKVKNRKSRKKINKIIFHTEV